MLVVRKGSEGTEVGEDGASLRGDPSTTAASAQDDGKTNTWWQRKGDRKKIGILRFAPECQAFTSFAANPLTLHLTIPVAT
jgi:hypothetical protein